MNNPIRRGIAFLVPFLVGCSSTYWPDRGWDALDIPTITLNNGIGIRARGGPVHAGIIMSAGDYGILNGAFIDQMRGYRDLNYEIVGVAQDYYHPAVIWGRDYHNDVKSYIATNSFPFLFLTSELDTSFADYDPPVNPYWTQLEFQACFVFGFRFGVNIGELVDFLLGFTTVDIYQDDSGSYLARKRKSSQAK